MVFFEKRWKWSATLLYSTSFGIMGLTFALLGPTLPALSNQTGSSLNDISFLFIARAIGSLVGSIGGGRFFDRVDGHRLVFFSLIVMALTVSLVPVIDLLWLLIAVLFLSGIVHGTLNVGGNAMLVWLRGESVAPYMNLLHFFFGLGTFLAPILVAQVLSASRSIAWSYWIVALMSLPVVAAALLIRSPAPVKNEQQNAQGRVDPWLLLGFFLIFFGYSGASAAYGGWIFTYVIKLQLADEMTAAYLNSIFWGALTAGRLLSIPFAIRFSPKAMLRFDLVGSLVSLVLITFFPHDLWVVGLGSAGFGFCLATIFPTNMSLASRHIPITGRVTGWLSIGSSMGALVLPWLVGQLFEIAGPHVLMTLNLANIGITLGIYFWLLRRLDRQVR